MRRCRNNEQSVEAGRHDGTWLWGAGTYATNRQLDRRIEQLVMAHPDGALFASLPGAGAVLVPRLIVALGTHRERYDSAFEVQCYSGIAPVKESSGKTSRVHFRRTCQHFCGRPFTSLLENQSGSPSGQNSFMLGSEQRGNRTT